ncbi:hypothetical protein [Corynebacterium sp. HMSC078H07]|uniref:hypothetical protein n=1 Tax=Corynebacterium sp. HMSC078H07 TaxID=1739379 RepID=UPI0008A2F1A6|nr:hypothetical protein [Corynebacterium sp. HMSC078H07]OFR67291.1 hypothetical protein HMPREF2875_06995 [Corynebacterium sp. HMSC078H07]
MSLHESLTDLSELAAHCHSPAHARGLLEEAQDLLRNATAHRADSLELAAWFSRIVTDLVRSPGLSSPVRLTGPAARGDLLPSMRITWLGEDEQLEGVITEAGLKCSAVEETTSARADAGLPVGHGGEEELYADALAKRPAPLTLVDGLPDRAADVAIRATLLAPVSAIARWAAPAPRPTPDRLAIGVERELLTASEAEGLSLAWGTGMALELGRWYEGVDKHSVALGDLPPLDRTAYGSACRTVSATVEAIVARHGRVVGSIAG